MAEDLVSFYHGNEPGQTPGLLPDPYYCAYSFSCDAAKLIFSSR
jgi:hypothetical protein